MQKILRCRWSSHDQRKGSDDGSLPLLSAFSHASLSCSVFLPETPFPRLFNFAVLCCASLPSLRLLSSTFWLLQLKLFCLPVSLVSGFCLRQPLSASCFLILASCSAHLSRTLSDSDHIIIIILFFLASIPPFFHLYIFRHLKHFIWCHRLPYSHDRYRSS